MLWRPPIIPGATRENGRPLAFMFPGAECARRAVCRVNEQRFTRAAVERVGASGRLGAEAEKPRRSAKGLRYDQDWLKKNGPQKRGKRKRPPWRECRNEQGSVPQLHVRRNIAGRPADAKRGASSARVQGRVRGSSCHHVQNGVGDNRGTGWRETAAAAVEMHPSGWEAVCPEGWQRARGRARPPARRDRHAREGGPRCKGATGGPRAGAARTVVLSADTTGCVGLSLPGGWKGEHAGVIGTMPCGCDISSSPEFD